MADMEEMIKEEISRIGGLQERVVFKDIVERLFLSLYETNQEMYRELESRIAPSTFAYQRGGHVCSGV